MLSHKKVVWFFGLPVVVVRNGAVVCYFFSLLIFYFNPRQNFYIQTARRGYPHAGYIYCFFQAILSICKFKNF